MLVLLQQTPCHEFFQPLLRPYVHYVPLRNDLTDLVAQITWARTHDDRVRDIVAAAGDWAASVGTQQGWVYYLERVFERYAAMMTYRPTRRKGAQRFVRETNCPNLRNYVCDDRASFGR